MAGGGHGQRPRKRSIRFRGLVVRIRPEKYTKVTFRCHKAIRSGGLTEDWEEAGLGEPADDSNQEDASLREDCLRVQAPF